MLLIRWIVTVFLCLLLVGVGICGSMGRPDGEPIILILFALLGLTIFCVWYPPAPPSVPPPPSEPPPSEPPAGS